MLSTLLWKKFHHIEVKDLNKDASAFGNKISVSNDNLTYAIGDPSFDNNRGKIRVYKNHLQVFSLEGDEEEEYLGTSFQLSGDGKVLIIGEPYYNNNIGRIKVFNLISNERFTLEGSIDDEDEYFGWDVALDYKGNTLGIVINNDSNGYVKIFRMKVVETNEDKISEDDNNTVFGYESVNSSNFTFSKIKNNSTAIYEHYQDIYDEFFIPLGICFNEDGRVLAISEKLKINKKTNLSEARIKTFKLISNDNSSSLTSLDKIITEYKEYGSYPISGCDIDGISSVYNFKLNDKGTILIFGENSYSTFDKVYRGRVRVFKFNNENCSWNLLGSEFLGENPHDSCGSSVDINSEVEGLFIVIGEQSYSIFDHIDSKNHILDCGRVRVFKFNEENHSFEQVGQTIQGEFQGDNIGVSVKLSKDKLFIGEPKFENLGRVRIFEKSFEKGVLLADGEELLVKKKQSSLKPESFCDECKGTFEDSQLSDINENIKKRNSNKKTVLTAIISPETNKIIEAEFDKNTNSIKTYNSTEKKYISKIRKEHNPVKICSCKKINNFIEENNKRKSIIYFINEFIYLIFYKNKHEMNYLNIFVIVSILFFLAIIYYTI